MRGDRQRRKTRETDYTAMRNPGQKPLAGYRLKPSSIRATIIPMKLKGSQFYFRPHSSLSKYINCFWISRSPESPSPSPAKNLILPDGGTEIIFNTGAPEKVYIAGHGTYIGTSGFSMVVGPRKHALLLEDTGKKEKIGIRFNPGGLYPFLQLPPHHIAGSTVGLDMLWGKVSQELEARLRETPDDPDKIKLLQNHLLRLLNPKFTGKHSVEFAVNQILETNGNISIHELVSHMGMSQKSLERRFLNRVGLTPKFFSRIVRIRGALKLIHECSSADWTDIGCCLGFYDQAHFIKEIKAFTGFTPTRFLDRSFSG